MCEQCCAKTETFLEPFPRWWLVRATKDGNIMRKGQWGLVHRNDPDFIWSVEPKLEPLTELSDEEINALPKDSKLWDDFNNWVADVETFRKSLEHHVSLEASWELIESARKAGYESEKSDFCTWLFNYLAEYLKGKKAFPPSLQDKPNYIEDNLEAFGYNNE